MPFVRRLNLPLVTLVAGVAVTLAVLASRVRDWFVMTDELQYAKLASAIADGSLLPTLRGVHVSAYAQLYPLLLSPLYALLDAPGAFEAAHVLNGALYASAAVPAYLLGRAARLSRPWSTVVAALTLAAPWNVLAAFLLTEPAAYAAFLWVLLACERALAVPSDWRDALAVAALAFAVLARVQFVVLVLVLPLAVAILDETRALRRHRLLAATYAVGALAAAVVALTGGLARLLGRYEVTATKGSLLPFDAVVHAGAHVDLVGLAVGLVPLLLGGAWLVTRRTPFSVLALVTIVALTLETSSYDARFASGLTPVRDRYLFYVAPLLLVATACALRDGVPKLALAGVTAFVAITIFAYDFVEVRGIYVDSPIIVAGGEIERAGGAAFVASIAIVIFLALVVVPASASARAAAVALVVAACSLTLSGATWTRLLTGRGPSGRAVTDGPTFVRDWIDRVLPAGSTVALVPYPVGQEWSLSAIFWWDIELWNDSAQRVYVVGGEWEYAPFPNHELRVDPITGHVRGTIDAPPYVVAAAGDARLRLAGVVHTHNVGLYILKAERPYRAEWMTRGLDPDGYTVAGRRAAIHIFSEPGHGPELVTLRVSFAAPPGAVAFRVGDQERELAAGTSAPERFAVCVAPPYGTNVSLEVTRAARGAGPPFAPGREQAKRNVGPRVTGVAVFRSREPC
jgi:hypothetical protein